MYQALYRKYRPSTFEEVAGQEVIVKTLKNAIAKEKITHAYLFTGPRGTGKTSIAKILAKTINCVDLKNGVPCDNCVSCTQINNRQATDIIEIDAASNNGVDEIRELKSKVNLVPSTSKYKIYIIDEVHMLTPGAFNALLKTLEEPPSHIIFILATTEPHKIPATILSRCQRFDFKKIGLDSLFERLRFIAGREQIEIDEEAIKEIARLSDGGLRDSISMLDQSRSYTDGVITIQEVHEINGTVTQQQLMEFITLMTQKDLEKVFTLLDKYNNQGKSLVKLSEEILSFFRNILLYQKVPNYLKNNFSNYELYQPLAKSIPEEELLQLMKTLNQALTDMQISNYPKMILELAIIQVLNTSPLAGGHKLEPVALVSVVKTQTTDLPLKEDKRTSVSSSQLPQPIVKVPSLTLQSTSMMEIPCSLSDEQKTLLLHIQAVRVENTLAEFSKKVLLEMKHGLELVRSMILHSEFSQAASLLLDGELKAASDDHLVFVYDAIALTDLFNESLLSLEKMFEHLYHKTYHLIAVSQEQWSKIKVEFNSKQKVYQVQEETFDLKELLTPKKQQLPDEMTDIFGDIVEYKS